MNPNDMSVQEIVGSIVFGLIYIGAIITIIWCASAEPCAFKGHEKPLIRMLHPTCWRCGKELPREDE